MSDNFLSFETLGISENLRDGLVAFLRLAESGELEWIEQRDSIGLGPSQFTRPENTDECAFFNHGTVFWDSPDSSFNVADLLGWAAGFVLYTATSNPTLITLPQVTDLAGRFVAESQRNEQLFVLVNCMEPRRNWDTTFVPPIYRERPELVTVEDAAAALRSFLETGRAKWNGPDYTARDPDE